MKIRKENSDLAQLIQKLDKGPQPIWRRTALLLARSRRRRVQVNVSKLELYAPDGKFILVPGKVLGSGDITKKLTVAAFSFSTGAKQRIESAGGKAITIDELQKANPKGKGILMLT